MNYNDQILENKAFNFFKQLMYNLAVAICVMLLGVLVLVYGFKFKLYEVLSDSQAPVYVEGDMVVVKEQTNYFVGDIVHYELSGGTPVTHRIVYIHSEGNKTYYICHGDNNQNVDNSENNMDWQDDNEYLINYFEVQNKTIADAKNKLSGKGLYHVDILEKTQIKGKVVTHVDNLGAYAGFIKEHYMLFIALVAGIWCVSSVVQNEIEIKRSLRLL